MKLAEGYGINDMLDICNKNQWSNDNTILVVDNNTNLDSHWTIYDKEE